MDGTINLNFDVATNGNMDMPIDTNSELMDLRRRLLGVLAHIENILNISPTTAEIRRQYKSLNIP